MSRLPSYEEVQTRLMSRLDRVPDIPMIRCCDEHEARPKRPTRKGLGRYVRDALMERRGQTTVDWHRRWFACISAREFLQDEFGVRLPSDTFRMDRILVLAGLENTQPIEERNVMGNPTARMSIDRTTRQQARRWASR